MRMPDGIEPGLAIEADRIYHQRVAVVASDRVAEPSGLKFLGVAAPVHINYMEPSALLEQKRQVLGVLHDLDGIAANVHGSHDAKRETVARVVELGGIVILEVVRPRRGEGQWAGAFLI